ncbi:hypothetical protein ACFL2K_03660 [Candidatus Margulisiibacteriota bacterium]
MKKLLLTIIILSALVCGVYANNQSIKIGYNYNYLFENFNTSNFDKYPPIVAYGLSLEYEKEFSVDTTWFAHFGYNDNVIYLHNKTDQTISYLIFGSKKYYSLLFQGFYTTLELIYGTNGSSFFGPRTSLGYTFNIDNVLVDLGINIGYGFSLQNNPSMVLTGFQISSGYKF